MGDRSYTPPPSCPPTCHNVPFPVWGQAAQGDPLQDFVLCFQSTKHHPVECRQCHQRPGCCHCLWRYHRSPYNSGCLLCRYSGPIIPPMDTSMLPTGTSMLGSLLATTVTTIVTVTATGTRATVRASYNPSAVEVIRDYDYHTSDSDMIITNLGSSSEEEIELPSPPYQPHPEADSPESPPPSP